MKWLKPTSEDRIREGSLWLLFSAYAIYLLLFQTKKNIGLSAYLLIPDYLHFFLIFAFLLIVDRENTFFLHPYGLIRRCSLKSALTERTKVLFRDTMLFFVPYGTLQIAAAIMDHRDIFSCIWAILVWYMGSLILGLLQIMIDLLFRTKHVGFLTLYLLLTLDFIQACGLLTSWDKSLFYFPVLSGFRTSAEESQQTALVLFVLLFLTFLVPYRLLFPSRRWRRFRLEISPAVLAGSAIGAGLSLFWILSHPSNIEVLLVWTFGMYLPEDKPDILSMILYLAPFVLTCLFFGNRISERLRQSAAIVISRTHDRSSWWGRQLVWLGLNYCLFFVFEILGATITGWVWGCPLRSFVSVIAVCGILFSSVGAVTFFMLVLSNLMALRQDPRVSLTVAAALHMTGYFLPLIWRGSVPSVISRLFLPGRVSLFLHSRSGVLPAEIGNVFFHEQEQLTVLGTALYVFLGIIVLLLAGCRRLNRMDIM